MKKKQKDMSFTLISSYSRFNFCENCNYNAETGIFCGICDKKLLLSFKHILHKSRKRTEPFRLSGYNSIFISPISYVERSTFYAFSSLGKDICHKQSITEAKCFTLLCSALICSAQEIYFLISLIKSSTSS